MHPCWRNAICCWLPVHGKTSFHMCQCRRGGGFPAPADMQAQSGDAEAAHQAEARALASAELLRRENRSTWQMLDERQEAIQRLEVREQSASRRQT